MDDTGIGGGIGGVNDLGLGGGGSSPGGAPNLGGGGGAEDDECLGAAGESACEARGCEPVTGRLLRVTGAGGDGMGGAAGAGGAFGGLECSRGDSVFVGCSPGSGGAINVCLCDASEPSTCIDAPSAIRFLETEDWVEHRNCLACGELF